MTTPARNTLAIIGAGPVGLEAAAAALDAGFDVHVFDRGDVGAHPIAWGHVRMFTPWRANVGPAAAARLRASGWAMPDADIAPTGLELAEGYLQPLAALPEFAAHVHAHSRVVHVSRSGLLKGDGGAAERAERPFRMLVRDQGGRENFIHAYAVIDATGVYAQPNWAGDGGIPARGELYLAPQMSYHLDDVRGLRRERHAGKRTLVIGAGTSAATVVSDLARLAAEAPGTTVTWITRRPAEALYRERANDPLASRRELFAEARRLVRGEDPAVRHVGGVFVQGIQYNSATHRYSLALMRDALPSAEEGDQIIVNAGYGPDDSLCRELQLHAPLPVGAEPQPTVDHLAHPEPNFYVLGHKSFGRSPQFLLETGYSQVAVVLAKLAQDLGVAAAR